MRKSRKTLSLSSLARWTFTFHLSTEQHSRRRSEYRTLRPEMSSRWASLRFVGTDLQRSIHLVESHVLPVRDPAATPDDAHGELRQGCWLHAGLGLGNGGENPGRNCPPAWRQSRLCMMTRPCHAPAAAACPAGRTRPAPPRCGTSPGEGSLRGAERFPPNERCPRDARGRLLSGALAATGSS